MLAATSGWNEAALLSAYRQGLDPRIRTQMAIYDNTVALESFMQKANRLAQRLSACHTTEAAHLYVTPVTSPPVPEPMELDSTRLSHAPLPHRAVSRVHHWPGWYPDGPGEGNCHQGVASSPDCEGVAEISSNFYRRFIKDFSLHTASLTSLL